MRAIRTPQNHPVVTHAIPYGATHAGAAVRDVREGGSPAGIFCDRPGQTVRIIADFRMPVRGKMAAVFPGCGLRYLVAPIAPYPNPRGGPIVPVDHPNTGPRDKECVARFAEMPIRR